LAGTPDSLDLCGRMEMGLLSCIVNPSVPPLARNDMPKSQASPQCLGNEAAPPPDWEIPLDSKSAGVDDFDDWASLPSITNESLLEFVKRYGSPHLYISRTCVEIVSRA